MGISWPVKERKGGGNTQNMDNSLIFGRHTTAVYMFAFVMYKHIFCIPVCFCRWAESLLLLISHKVLQELCICKIYLQE